MGSSRTSTGASARSARASTRRWRCPPESRVPSSPTSVSSPSGSDSTQSRELRTPKRLVELGVGRVGARQAAGSRGSSNRRRAPPGRRARTYAATSSCAQLSHVVAVDRDAPALRVEEAEEEIRHRRLAGAARADERHALPRLESQVESVEGGRFACRVPRRHRARARTTGRAAGAASGEDRVMTVGSRSMSSRTRRPAATVAASSWAAAGSGSDSLERRKGEQCDGRHEDRIERACRHAPRRLRREPRQR